MRLSGATSRKVYSHTRTLFKRFVGLSVASGGCSVSLFNSGIRGGDRSQRRFFRFFDQKLASFFVGTEVQKFNARPEFSQSRESCESPGSHSCESRKKSAPQSREADSRQSLFVGSRAL